jgi:hypothetical protein
MKLLNGVLGALPSRLSCFGAGEDAVNRPYTGGDNPPFIYPGGESPVDMTQMLQPATTSYLTSQPVQPTTGPQNILQPATTEEPYTYTGPGKEMEYGVTAPAAPSASGAPQVAVQPSTSAQIVNLVNTVAKGLLEVQQTQAQTKLSTAQIAAAAEASKVQAQNYVMQQLQQGKQVMVPETWLQKYGSSDTLTKWLTPILIIGGVGLLGYIAYVYMKKSGKASSKTETTVQGLGSVPSTSLSGADASMAAANPRRGGRRRRR